MKEKFINQATFELFEELDIFEPHIQRLNEKLKKEGIEEGKKEGMKILVKKNASQEQ
jgi:hypothetical protein